MVQKICGTPTYKAPDIFPNIWFSKRDSDNDWFSHISPVMTLSEVWEEEGGSQESELRE